MHIIIVMHIHKFLSATSWDNLGSFLDLILVLEIQFVISPGRVAQQKMALINPNFLQKFSIPFAEFCCFVLKNDMEVQTKAK